MLIMFKVIQKLHQTSSDYISYLAGEIFQKPNQTFKKSNKLLCAQCMCLKQSHNSHKPLWLILNLSAKFPINCRCLVTGHLYRSLLSYWYLPCPRHNVSWCPLSSFQSQGAEQWRNHVINCPNWSELASILYVTKHRHLCVDFLYQFSSNHEEVIGQSWIHLRIFYDSLSSGLHHSH